MARTSANVRDRFLWGALCIAAAALLAYFPALGAGFVFDDHDLIENSEALRGPLSRLWLGGEGPDYWPLSFTTFWLEWRIFGSNPAGYHAFNLLLHIGAAVLFWRVLRTLGVPGAWVAGLLFAVHPVTVESVAWISERKNTLSAVFFAATALTFLHFVERRRPATYLATLALFAAAILAKASVVMLPVALLVVLAWHGERRRAVYWTTVPLFALSLLGGLITMWFQWVHAMPRFMVAPRGAWERLGGAGWALATYLETAFLPVRVALLYAPWPLPDAASFYVPLLLVAISALVLTVLCWRGVKAARAIAAALAFQAVMLLPVLGFVDIVFFSFAPASNHLQYLALMGPLALVGAVAGRLWQSASTQGTRAIAMVAGVVLLALLAGHTFVRSRAFHDDVSLFARAIREAPQSFVAWREYSSRLVEAGRRPEAIAAIDEAVRILEAPDARWQARAVAFMARGQFAAAADAAFAAHQARPNPSFIRDVGMDLVLAGQTQHALRILEPVRRQHPGYADLHYWVGAALARQDQREKALAVLKEAAALAPRDEQIRTALELLQGAARTSAQ